MSVLLKPLFDVLTGNVAVMVLYNYLILLVVGELAYRVAWNFVGDLYRVGMIDGKASGSIIHWIIRLIAYVVCAYTIRGGIWLYRFVVAIPHWVWWLLLGIAVTAVVVTIAITSKDIVITLTGDTFKAITAATSLNAWVTNLPAGLTATAKATTADGASSVTITVAGTPTATLNQAVAITIPAASLNGGANVAIGDTTVTITVAGTPTATLGAAIGVTIPAASLANNVALTATTNPSAKFAIAEATLGDVTITGTKSTAITSKDIVITLTGDTFKAITAATSLNAWVTNLPAGLTATAKATTADGASSVTITVAGTPTATLNQAVAITIPAASLNGGANVTVTANANAKFVIAEAVLGNVTIDGLVNSAITSQDIVITLTGDTIKTAITAGTSLATWVTNLPAGLTATAKSNVAIGDTTVTITVAGISTAALAVSIAVTIPASALNGGADVIATANTSAKFDITTIQLVSVSGNITANNSQSIVILRLGTPLAVGQKFSIDLASILTWFASGSPDIESYQDIVATSGDTAILTCAMVGAGNILEITVETAPVGASPNQITITFGNGISTWAGGAHGQQTLTITRSDDSNSAQFTLS